MKALSRLSEPSTPEEEYNFILLNKCLIDTGGGGCPEKRASITSANRDTDAEISSTIIIYILIEVRPSSTLFSQDIPPPPVSDHASRDTQDTQVAGIYISYRRKPG